MIPIGTSSIMSSYACVCRNPAVVGPLVDARLAGETWQNSSHVRNRHPPAAHGAEDRLLWAKPELGTALQPRSHGGDRSRIDPRGPGAATVPVQHSNSASTLGSP
jgi:hypothetical protein